MPTRFDPDCITADEMRARREETGEGMREAKDVLRTGRLRAAFDDLRLNGTLEEKVEWLLDRYEEENFPSHR